MGYSLYHKLREHEVDCKILAFVLRQGRKFEDGKIYWTIVHLKRLKNLDLEGLTKETLS